MSRRSRARKHPSSRGRFNRRGNPPEWGDWVIGGTGLNNVGGPIALTGWNGGLGTLASGTPQTFILVGEPTPASLSTATLAPPSVGEVEIAEVAGSLFFTAISGSADKFFLAVAIYVTEFNMPGTNWAVRDPLNPVEAVRDDYLFLRAMTFFMPNQAGGTSEVTQEVRVAIPSPEVIGGGEALVLTMSMVSASASTLGYMPFVRSRLRAVA